MKLALLTGATGVLGRDLARLLATDYRLVLHYRSSEEVARRLLEEPSVRRSVVKVVRWDFGRESLDGFLEEVMRVGVPELVVLSASHYDSTPTDRVSEELFNYLVKVNLVAPTYLALKLGKAMEGGLIVLITDLITLFGHEVYVGLKPSLPYVASRGSLQLVIKYLAKELAPRARVIGIAVGWIENPRMDSRLRERALRSIPTRSFVNPREVYRLIKHAEESPSLNGVFVTLSGGL